MNALRLRIPLALLRLGALSFFEPGPGLAAEPATATGPATAERKLLYVAAPGIRNYLEYGGHGLLVFDIDREHRVVKRIALAGLDEQGQPLNVKGICANATTKKVFVSTTKTLTCLDLVPDRVLWQKAYEGGCDRMSILPAAGAIYVPPLERPHW